MPDSPTRLSQIEVHGLYQAVLGTPSAAAGWLPPAPESLAASFPGYEILSLAARGGMGAVYRARQLSLGRIVAVKLLPFDLGVREDFAERFRREAAALARLNHPNIVTVYDFGQADDGHFFMVMEYVEGTDLATRLRTGGPLPAGEALGIVRQVCEALHHAHMQGVVHRDIKPANVLLDAAGRVKVGDFGIAQFAHEEAAGDLTVTGVLLGTPGYTAPEQLTPGAEVDRRADIFSVGVMLYEMLTGRLPRGVFRPVSELTPAARGLDAVVGRAMQSEPGRRYQNVMELEAGLVKAGRPRRWLRAAPWAVAAAVAAAAALMFLFAASRPGWFREVVAQPVPVAVPPETNPVRPPPPAAADPGPNTQPAVSAPAAASAAAPFINSLGLGFVPAGTEGVLFCTTEVRVRDYEPYARGRGTYWEDAMYLNFDGVESSWTPRDVTWQAPPFPQTPDHPVIGVTYVEATAFCEWLTRHEQASARIGTADSYRLPTDAEWSVAAGLEADAHDPSRQFPWGGPYPPSAAAGNFAGEEVHEDPEYTRLPVIPGRRDAHRFTAPVGSYPANLHGLHDMGGNLMEMVNSETEGAQEIKLRGSSWWDASSQTLDSGARRPLGRSVRSFVVGFRIVLERPASRPAPAATPAPDPS